jgi:hypothetical protein
MSLCCIKHHPLATYKGTEVLSYTLIQQYIPKFTQYQLLNEQVPVPVICTLKATGSNLRLFTFHTYRDFPRALQASEREGTYIQAGHFLGLWCPDTHNDTVKNIITQRCKVKVKLSL